MTSPAAAARAAIDRRAPPHDVAAEQAVFRALIYEPSSFALASAIVSTDDFYETRHQLLWGVIAASNAEGASPDAALLADLVGRNGIGQKIGGEAYLAELARDGLPSATLVEHHARIVKERSIRRKVLAAGQALSEAAHTPGLDVKAFVSEETEYLREVLAEAAARSLRLDDFAPTLPTLLAEPDPEQSWVIDELLESAGGMLLYGPSYVGKSLSSWFSALCVARGYGAVLNRGVDAPPANAVIFYGESTRRQVKNAFRRFLSGEAFVPETLRLVDVHAVSPFPDLARPEGRDWYEKVLVEAGAKYAVFDSATALVGDDLNDGLVASSVMTFLSQLGKKHGIARCLVHHTRKASTHGEKGSSADKAAGAAQWVRLADTAVLIESDGPGRVKIDPWKIRDHEQGKPYVARIAENLHFEFIAEIGPGAAPGRRRPPGETAKGIVEKLHDCREWLTAKDLADLLGVTTRAVQMATSSKLFVQWAKHGFIETEQANGPNPVRYRSTGALPPEVVG